MGYETLDVSFRAGICTARIERGDADNTIDARLVEELGEVVALCEDPTRSQPISVLVKIGAQKAHYMTLMTRPVEPEEAQTWGLVDAVEDHAEPLLRKHLIRLQRLSKPAIGRYKQYMVELSGGLAACKPGALAANREMFQDPANQRNIRRYVTEGKFPWEP